MAEAETKDELDRRRRELEHKRVLAEAQIAAIRSGIDADEEEMKKMGQQEKNRKKAEDEQRKEMARRRRADMEA